MINLTGIDPNGLCAVSVDTVDKDVLRGGEVPAVVIVQPSQNGEQLRVIAGAEAAMAIEGRGWHWPPSAQVIDEKKTLRVPLQHILTALLQNDDIDVAGKKRRPTELLAAAIDALARPRAPSPTPGQAREAVIAVPDDGRFLEEARQRLIDAALQGGLTPTLLWRPVAALLGLEPQLSAEDVSKLSGCTVGVLSCLEDGVHAARIEVEVKTDKTDGDNYFVPVRKIAGIVVPYRRSIIDLAEELARRYAPSDDPQAGWQLLWGNGLVLNWLLRLKAQDNVLQTGEGWRLIPNATPENVPQIEFEEDALDRLNRFIDGVDYRVFEGPALEATAYGMRLVYFLHDRVARTAPPLNYAIKNIHLAAHGCAVYQQRRHRGRVTYYDYLPQLRLAVRRDKDPDFLDIIPRDARVEGGDSYEEKLDLGLSVQPGTSTLNFYLLREGDAKPRHVTEELGEHVTMPVPISLRIRQQPAQGTARLTLVAAKEGIVFRPVELHWERMVEEDLTEAQILDRLRQEPVNVPPVQPQPSHSLLWTSYHSGTGGSLVYLVPMLATELEKRPPNSDDLIELLRGLSVLLTRRSSPALLTQRREHDQSLYRAISSDGAMPEPSNDLHSGLLDLFDACLADLDELVISDGHLETSLRAVIVRAGGWCFQRCPSGIRQTLLDTTRDEKIPDAKIYYGAMGKVFAEKVECQAFFSLLERQLAGKEDRFKQYQIEGLFYLLSLREAAPFALKDQQATLFASKLLSLILDRVRSGKALSRQVNMSLKAYAGLMRYRLVRPDYMTPKDAVLGAMQQQVFDALLRRCRRERKDKMVDLATSLIEWSEERGTDLTILQWDAEED